MKNLIDFRRLVNPLGMPESVRDALKHGIEEGVPEPFDEDFSSLREMIGQRHRAAVAQIAVSHVEEELICLLAAASGARKALLPTPCPPSYERALKQAGVEACRWELSPRHNFRFAPGELRAALNGCDLLLMGNPAFPSGGLVPPGNLLEEVDEWASRGGWLIIDESMLDFTYGGIVNSVWSGVRYVQRAALIRSFTASLSLAVCPLCYAVGGAPWLSEVRSRQFHPALAPLAACLTAPLEGLMGFRGDTVDCISDLRNKLIGRLRRISGLRPLPSDANWVLCSLERDDVTVPDLVSQLNRRGIIIEPCVDGAHFALALRPMTDLERFIRAAREILMPKKDYQKLLPLN